MLNGLRTLALALGVFVCAGLASPPRVDYTFTPVMEAGVLSAVRIDLRFRGDADGETALRLPDEWGGQRELWRSIEALGVVSGAALADGESPARRVLTHAPNARIHVRYQVAQDWAGEPNTERGNEYRPIIQPSYFHLIGDAALVIPEIDGAAIVHVRAHNLPRGWSFASDLQHRPLNLARANASVIVGGDYRVMAGADPNIRIAMRGAWSFTDADFTARTAEIIAGQRRFWGDASSPYLVTVTQLAAPSAGWMSIGGTGLGDAFALFATPNAQAGMLTRTLAHEGLHTWIPGRIGGAPEQDEAAQYWLSEGFTDFYTGRVLVREGLWTPAEFAEDLNQMLSEYARSPVRAEPNARILADFWSTREVQQLPYQRGRLLATIWDARLRASGRRDLDDVMFAMSARAEAGDPLKAGEMFPIVAAAAGLDVGADLSAHIERGAPISLPEQTLAPCGSIVIQDVAEFELGFDSAASEARGNVITGVSPHSRAYAAGLRDGMSLLRFAAGAFGDPAREIGIVVIDGGRERTIRYLPRGSRTFTQQSLVLAPDLTGERLARCVAVIGGA